MREQQQHIMKALNVLQSDKSSIATACEQWLELLNCPDLQQHRQKIQKRCDQVLTPAHYLANLLHPEYRGKLLNAQQKIDAQHKLVEIDADLLPEFLAFLWDAIMASQEKARNSCHWFASDTYVRSCDSENKTCGLVAMH